MVKTRAMAMDCFQPTEKEDQKIQEAMEKEFRHGEVEASVPEFQEHQS
jgi:hypothetical protein